MPRIKTFYEELGVERSANAAEIKHAFKEAAKTFHPDKNPEKQEWAHEQMSRLNFIVETLLNPATRQEYDGIIKKYEEAPVVTRPRRAAREQNAIEREYAQVSVEIMNLAGKYSNCRLKMMIGSIIGGLAAIIYLSVSYFPPLMAYADDFPMSYAFSYFFALIGGVMIVIGLSDYLGRGQYRRRIRELEERRSHLRERMYEALVSF